LERFLESELPISQHNRKLISTPSTDSTKSEIAYKQKRDLIAVVGSFSFMGGSGSFHVTE
jgi:hypothetical protein